jgi:hypothetical protein
MSVTGDKRERICRTECSAPSYSELQPAVILALVYLKLQIKRWTGPILYSAHIVSGSICSVQYKYSLSSVQYKHTFMHDHCQMWNNSVAYLLPRRICTEFIYRGPSLTWGEMYASRLNFLLWLSFDPQSISYPFLVALLVFRFCYGNTCFYYCSYSLLLFFIYFALLLLHIPCGLAELLCSWKNTIFFETIGYFV